MEKKFHEIIKEARLNAGLTQSQLAEKIGVAKSTYCNWEQGTREPNVLKLKAIAKALGVTGDYLLGLEEPNPFHAIQNNMVSYYSQTYRRFNTVKRRIAPESAVWQLPRASLCAGIPFALTI